MSLIKSCVLYVQTSRVTLEYELDYQVTAMMKQDDERAVDVLFYEPEQLINVIFGGTRKSLRLEWSQWNAVLQAIDDGLRDMMICTYVGDLNNMPEDFVKYLKQQRECLVVSIHANMQTRLHHLKKLKRMNIRFRTDN